MYTLANVQPQDAGQYTVAATSGTEAVESRPATLTVSAAPVITGHPASQVVFAATNVTFTVAATGAGLLTYQWFKENTAIAGATGSALVLANVQSVDAGSYTVLVSNADRWPGAVLAVRQFRRRGLTRRPLPVPADRARRSAGHRQVSDDLTDHAPSVTGVTNVQDPLPAASGSFYRPGRIAGRNKGAWRCAI